MRKLLLISAATLVPICAWAKGDTSVSGLSVDPPLAKSLHPLELGELLLAATELPRDSIPWDFLSEKTDYVLWLTNGIKEEHHAKDWYRREGLVRVHVMDQWSTVLRNTKMELSWHFNLVAENSSRYGAQEIDIAPGPSQGDGACFGTIYNGCTFNPTPSMTKVGLHPVQYCENRIDAENGTKFFDVSYNGKSRFILGWASSGGSGGATTDLEIYPLSRKTEVCSQSKPPS